MYNDQSKEELMKNEFEKYGITGSPVGKDLNLRNEWSLLLYKIKLQDFLALHHLPTVLAKGLKCFDIIANWLRAIQNLVQSTFQFNAPEMYPRPSMVSMGYLCPHPTF